jgi:hypothetical protein
MNIFQDVQDSIDPLNTFCLPISSPRNTIFDFDLSYQDENLFSITQPPAIQGSQLTNPVEPESHSTGAAHSITQSTAITMAGISTSEGASFFQTYFEIVHPRYPFLDVEECSGAYLKWKAGEIATCNDNGWSVCLLKLVRIMFVSCC